MPMTGSGCKISCGGTTGRKFPFTGLFPIIGRAARPLYGRFHTEFLEKEGRGGGDKNKLEVFEASITKMKVTGKSEH